jgi:hypothetical protein
MYHLRMEATRRCRDCGRSDQDVPFVARERWCKPCRAAYMRRWHAEHPDQRTHADRREYQAAYQREYQRRRRLAKYGYTE